MYVLLFADFKYTHSYIILKINIFTDILLTIIFLYSYIVDKFNKLTHSIGIPGVRSQSPETLNETEEYSMAVGSSPGIHYNIESEVPENLRVIAESMQQPPHIRPQGMNHQREYTLASSPYSQDELRLPPREDFKFPSQEEFILLAQAASRFPVLGSSPSNPTLTQENAESLRSNPEEPTIEIEQVLVQKQAYSIESALLQSVLAEPIVRQSTHSKTLCLQEALEQLVLEQKVAQENIEGLDLAPILLVLDQSSKEEIAQETTLNIYDKFSFPMWSLHNIEVPSSMIEKMRVSLDSSLHKIKSFYKDPNLTIGNTNTSCSTYHKEVHKVISAEIFNVLNSLRLQILYAPEIFDFHSILKSTTELTPIELARQNTYVDKLFKQITEDILLHTVLAKDIENITLPAKITSIYWEASNSERSVEYDIKHTISKYLRTMGSYAVLNCIQECEKATNEIIKTGDDPSKNKSLIGRITSISAKLACFYSIARELLDLTSPNHLVPPLMHYPYRGVLSAHITQKILLRHVRQMHEQRSPKFYKNF